MDDDTIKRIAQKHDLPLPLMREEVRIANACYAEGQRDAQQRIAELERDAARYRWLRGDSCRDYCARWARWEVRLWHAPFWTGDLRGIDLDREVDAALKNTDKPDGT